MVTCWHWHTGSVKYYVNLCGQTHTNTTCLGRDGEPIYGLACQQGTAMDSISGQSFAVGLGDTMAFYDLPGPTSQRDGLMVSIQVLLAHLVDRHVYIPSRVYTRICTCARRACTHTYVRPKRTLCVRQTFDCARARERAHVWAVWLNVRCVMVCEGSCAAATPTSPHARTPCVCVSLTCS